MTTRPFALASLKPSDGDAVPARFGGSKKQVFLRDGKKFLRAVGSRLAERGVTDVVVRSNPGGVAITGESSLNATLADGRKLWIQIGGDLAQGSCALVWRIGTKPYATDGNNRWVPAEKGTVDGVVADILAVIARTEKE